VTERGVFRIQGSTESPPTFFNIPAGADHRYMAKASLTYFGVLLMGLEGVFSVHETAHREGIRLRQGFAVANATAERSADASGMKKADRQVRPTVYNGDLARGWRGRILSA
jgi:hypothetical protein